MCLTSRLIWLPPFLLPLISDSCLYAVTDTQLLNLAIRKDTCMGERIIFKSKILASQIVVFVNPSFLVFQAAPVAQHHLKCSRSLSVKPAGNAFFHHFHHTPERGKSRPLV